MRTFADRIILIEMTKLRPPEHAIADEAVGGEVVRLRWQVAGLGHLFLSPVLVFAMVLFGIAAFDPDQLQTLAEDRRNGLIRLAQPMTMGGINVPMLFLALVVAFELFRFGWRWADETALTATGAGIHFHASTFRRALPWEEVREVRFYSVDRTWATKVPVIEIAAVSGKRHRIAGVENGNHEAEQFALSAKQRADRARSSGSHAVSALQP